MSMSVTRTPSAAKMLAYSRPITPAPITASDRGTCSMFNRSSLVKMDSPSHCPRGSRMVVGCLAERLARNGADVDADAAGLSFFIHDRDTLFQLGSLNDRPVT